MDKRYSKLQVISEPCLDPLAKQITIRNIVTGVVGLKTIFSQGNVLLGNLRAATMMLHPTVTRRNDAFIHDNTHYLNLKAKLLVAFIVSRSMTTYFPCYHSTLRLPFYSLLKSRIAIDYFSLFRPLKKIKRSRPVHLKIAVIGRIEPAKNTSLAVDIANQLADSGIQVDLTLLGSIINVNYYSDIVNAVRNPALTLTQQEVTHAEVSDMIKKQEFILHTSVAESLPLVLFEANSLGIPFFALPVGGIPEVLPEKYWIDFDIVKSVRQIHGTLYS